MALNHKLLKEAESKINNIQVKEAESYLSLTTEELVKRALERFGRKSDADAILRGIKKHAQNDAHMILAALSFANNGNLEKDAVCKELVARLQKQAIDPLSLTLGGAAGGALAGKTMHSIGKHKLKRNAGQVISSLLQNANSPEEGLAVIQTAIRAGYDPKTISQELHKLLEEQATGVRTVKKEASEALPLSRALKYILAAIGGGGLGFGAGYGTAYYRYKPEGIIGKLLDTAETPSDKVTILQSAVRSNYGSKDLAKKLLDSLKILNKKQSSLQKDAALPLVATSVLSGLAGWGAPKLWGWFKNKMGWGPNSKLFMQNLSLVHDPYVALKMMQNWQAAGGKIGPEQLQALQRMIAARSNPWFSGRY